MDIKSILIISHPRSGTHLTIDFIRKQFKEFNGWVYPWEPIYNLILDLDHLMHFTKPHLTRKKASSILSRSDLSIVKSHMHNKFEIEKYANTELVQSIIKNSVKIYVVRDVRDVLCSSHTWLNSRKPISEFIREKNEFDMNRVEYWAYHLKSWISEDDIHVIKYEDLLSKPERALEELEFAINSTALYKEPLLPKKRKSDTRLADLKNRILRNWESTAILGRPNARKPVRWHEEADDSVNKFLHKYTRKIMEELQYI